MAQKTKAKGVPGWRSECSRCSTRSNQWARAKGYAVPTIALADDSAGGSLPLSTVVRARNQGLVLPTATVALSSARDLVAEGRPHRTVDNPLITRALMDLLSAMYLPNGEVGSCAATPLYSAEQHDPPAGAERHGVLLAAVCADDVWGDDIAGCRWGHVKVVRQRSSATHLASADGIRW